ncbi:MAG TPA: glycosyltransferase family 39 protein [Bacteroidota bacterium]|nr:glycosyltransferase family 39 protein [Bacteroidota bacterium]
MISAVVLFILSSWGAALLLACVGFILGRRACASLSLRFDSLWDEISYSVCTGLGAIALVLFGIGTAGLLRWESAAAAMALLVALCLWGLCHSTTKFSDLFRASPAHLLVTVVIAALLVPLAVLALYPPTANDALAYHLAAAKAYVQSGRVTPTPELRYAVFPQLAEMLYSACLLLGGDTPAQCMSLLFLLLTCAGIVGFLRGAFGGKTALWGGALLLSSSAVTRLGAVAYVDIVLTAFVTLSVLAVERWRRENSRGWLILGAILSGCACGVKYSALFFPLILALLIAGAWKERPVARPVVSALLTCAAVALPWYAYSALQTGNPVWPFFPRLFGLSYWNEADLAGQMTDLLSAHGSGRGLGALLLLPWNLFAHPELFHTDGVLSVPFLVSIPFALYGALYSATVRRLLFVVIAYTVFWFFSAQILRYLVPVLPLLALAEGAGMRLFVARVLPRAFGDSGLFATLAALVLIAPGWMGALHEVGMRGLPPVTPDGRESYLARSLRSYGAVAYLNRHRGPAYTLYAYNDPQMAYFTAGRFRGDFFGPWRYSRISPALEAGEDTLLHALQEMGVTHLLVRDDPSGSDCEKGWLSRHFVVPVYRSPGVVLFELSERPLRILCGSDIVSKDSSAHAGISIQASVKGEQLYYCSLRSPRRPSGGLATLEVAWLARGGATIRRDQSSWIMYAQAEDHGLLASAPREAASALLSVDAGSDSLTALLRPSMCEVRFVP